MEWTDEALVIGTRRHGEANAVLDLMTRERGRHTGLVRGGRGRRLAATLQPGNTVRATWRARLDEHLGLYTVELVEARAARLIATALGVHGVQTVAAHLRLLPERDPHAELLDAAFVLLDHLEEAEVAGALMARFELAVLEALGFGLDLGACALTGATADLAYVSPKTGRAASREAGAPYADRLLALPAFLLGEAASGPTAEDVRAALRLTGHFLVHHVVEPRGLPPDHARDAFVALVAASR